LAASDHSLDIHYDRYYTHIELLEGENRKKFLGTWGALLPRSTIMEADWDELSRIPVPPPGPHALPTIATTIAFDDVMELLWMGNEFVSTVLWAVCEFI
jgi:hypothetical protein